MKRECPECLGWFSQQCRNPFHYRHNQRTLERIRKVLAALRGGEVSNVALALLLLLAGCSGDVRVSGVVTHRFEVSVSELRGYFEDLCARQGDPDPSACAGELVGDLLERLGR